MANGQSSKTTKMQPVPQGTGNRRRRRNPKNKTKNKRPQQQQARRTFVRRTARNAAKAEVHRLGLSGPKVAVSQTVTATLGTIGANQGDKVELELASLLNPALVKEQSGSNAFGPVQALAAQFGLWRCSQAHLSFTPLVGSSAVSGTAVRASLNLTSTPGSTSWSGLGARVHKDVMVGQHATFHLARKQLNGPRETWWLTNTNDDKTQSLGPTIEVHSLGKTTSTYQNTDYTGSLFLVELRATWEFSNYLTQPALATLVKEEAPAGTVTVDAATPGNPVTITVNDPGTAARLSRVAPATRARAAGDVGETILQVVDTSVSVASGVLPPPFGWLLAGGWWFVKRLAGVQRAGTASFYVYASAEDAAANRPCIADGTSNEVTLPGVVHFNQINTPNTGVSTAPAVSLMRTTTDPPQPGTSFSLWANVTQPAIRSNSTTFDQNLFYLVHDGAGTTTSELLCFQVGEDDNYRHAINQAWILTSPIALQAMQALPLPAGFPTLKLRWNGRLKEALPLAWASTVTNSQPSGDDRVCQTFILWQGVTEGSFTTTNNNIVAYTHSIQGTGTAAKVVLATFNSTGQVNCATLNNAFLLTRSFGKATGSAARRYTDGTSVLYGPDSQIPNGSYPNFHMGPSGFGKPYEVAMAMVATRPTPFTLQSTPLSVGRSADLHTDEFDVLEGRVSVDTSSDTDYETDTTDDTSDSEPEDFVDWAFQMSAKYTTGDDLSAPLREKIGKLLVEEGVPADAAQRRAMLAAPTPAFQDFLHAHQEVLSDGFGSRRVIHSDLSDRAVDLGLSYLSSRGHAE
ncbi:capsid protein [Marmot astrovirus 1]|nr:capsid protein [Marmot astrovirus 1]